MNNVEISKIKDSGLRTIRMKYWNLKHKAIVSKYKISDQELGSVLDKLEAEEEKEVSAYLAKREEQDNA